MSAWVSITIGPLFIIVYIYFIIFQISIQQIQKPSVSLAVSVSELESEFDARSNMTGL